MTASTTAPGFHDATVIEALQPKVWLELFEAYGAPPGLISEGATLEHIADRLAVSGLPESLQGALEWLYSLGSPDGSERISSVAREFNVDLRSLKGIEPVEFVARVALTAATNPIARRALDRAQTSALIAAHPASRVHEFHGRMARALVDSETRLADFRSRLVPLLDAEDLGERVDVTLRQEEEVTRVIIVRGKRLHAPVSFTESGRRRLPHRPVHCDLLVYDANANLVSIHTSASLVEGYRRLAGEVFWGDPDSHAGRGPSPAERSPRRCLDEDQHRVLQGRSRRGLQGPGRVAMQLRGDSPLFFATDLTNFLGCRHLTAVEWLAAHRLAKRPYFDDPMLEILRERGLAHERAYVEHLAGAGKRVISVERHSANPLDETLHAMREGADVIVQARLEHGVWAGWADVLLRSPGRSAFGAWQYEPVETKLAKETRGATLVQLCLYAELLAQLQGAAPELLRVVVPDSGFRPESYRFDEFRAYFRLVRRNFEAELRKPMAVSVEAATPYPDPVPHCDACNWCSVCDGRRTADDHVSLVAGIQKTQRKELAAWGVTTLAALAQLPIPFERSPSRGSVDALVRMREQARLQSESRAAGRPVYELLPVEVPIRRWIRYHNPAGILGPIAERPRRPARRARRTIRARSR